MTDDQASSHDEDSRPVRLDKFSRDAIERIHQHQHDPLEPNLYLKDEFDEDLEYLASLSPKPLRSYIFTTRVVMFVAGVIAGIPLGVYLIGLFIGER